MDRVATGSGESTDAAMTFRSVRTVLVPRSIAIVGASDRGEGGWSRTIFENLRNSGFPATVHLINPRRDEMWGQPCHPNFSALDERVEHALMMVPAHAVAEVLEDGAANGLKSATIYSAGFGEGTQDKAGVARAEALRGIVDRWGLRLCGPNCMGGVAVHEGLPLYPSPRVRNLARGAIGCVFQSGGTLQFWIEQAAARGLGFSYAVTSGNEIDLDLVDFINFLVEDPATRVIACLVEGVRRPDALLQVARKAHSAGKPILLVKIGRTEKASLQALSHTGAIAGDDAVFDAVCRRYGIVRCNDMADMVEMAMVFADGRIPTGSRMGLLTTSGAVKGLALDAAGSVRQSWGRLSETTCRKLRELSSTVSDMENPLDCGPAPVADTELYSSICSAMLEDEEIDMLAFLARTPLSNRAPDRPEPFATMAAHTEKPVLAFAHMARPTTDYGRKFQARSGLPFIHGISQAIDAMSTLATYGESQRAGIPDLPGSGEAASGANSEVLRQRIGQTAAKFPREAFAASGDEAMRAARRIGFPVAVKLVSPDASHKTEADGVAIGLDSPDAVARATERMARRSDGRVRIDGYLVQEMVSGLEVIVGFREDPQYGPFVVVGLGGVFVEALNDTSLRLLPVTPDEAREMIAELRSAQLFGPFRGQPPRDVAALSRAVSELGDVFLDFRLALSDLEINPIMVGAEGQGVRAVDVRPIWRNPEVNDNVPRSLSVRS